MIDESHEVFEYDCPVQGMDLDIEPPPAYGSVIQCSACGGEHVADETLGIVWRVSGEELADVTDEWKARK